MIDRLTAPAVKPRSPLLSPEGTLRYPNKASSNPIGAKIFLKHKPSAGSARLHAKPSGMSRGSPPDMLLGATRGRALTPRRTPRGPPGRGHMAVPLMRLPRKQDEPPASQLAGGPKGWMLGHGPAPCGPRHVARPNLGPSSPLGHGPAGSPSRGPAQQTGIFSSVIKTAFSVGKRPARRNDAGHLIKEDGCPHSIGHNDFRALNSPERDPRSARAPLL